MPSVPGDGSGRHPVALSCWLRVALAPLLLLLAPLVLLAPGAGAQQAGEVVAEGAVDELPADASARTGDLEVRVVLEPPEVTVGDLFEYGLVVEGPSGFVLAEPEPPTELEPFEGRGGFELIATESSEGRTRYRFRWGLAAFATGVLRVPPPRLVARVATEDVPLTVPEVGLRVMSVLDGSEEQALHPAKGVLRLPPWLPIWAMVLIGLAFAAAVLRYLWTRRRVIATAPPPEPALTYSERALRDLEALAASDLLRRGEVKAYYVRLAEIIRQFLASHHGVDALEMTSGELAHALRSRKVRSEGRQLVQRILALTDMAKFARYVPMEFEREGVFDAARAIIIEGFPVAPSPTPAPQQGVGAR